MMANEMDVEIHYTKEKTEPLSTIREEEYDDEEGNVSPTLIPFDSETMPVSFVATRGIVIIIYIIIIVIIALKL